MTPSAHPPETRRPWRSTCRSAGGAAALAEEAATTINNNLFALRFPDLPWPGPPPDLIIHNERRGGQDWRLRADGQWEVLDRNTWQPVRWP